MRKTFFAITATSLFAIALASTEATATSEAAIPPVFDLVSAEAGEVDAEPLQLEECLSQGCSMRLCEIAMATGRSCRYVKCFTSCLSGAGYGGGCEPPDPDSPCGHAASKCNAKCGGG